MRRLFKRKGSDIWQGRFRIPENLWRQRDRLLSLGVRDIGKAQEFGRSTGKQDRDEAGKAYRAMLDAWEAKTQAWQALLDTGPESLSHKQRLALAADHARAFLARHEDEPFDAPPKPALPEIAPDGDAAWLAMVGRMASAERESLKADLKEFLRAKGERRSKLAFRLLQKYPGLGALVGQDLAAGLEALHGVDTDGALSARGLHVDAVTRRLVNLEMLGFMGAASERGGWHSLSPHHSCRWEHQGQEGVGGRYSQAPY
jgi:hypothetical protein